MSSFAIRQVSRSYSPQTFEASAEGGLFKPEERIADRYVVQSLLGEGPTGFSYAVHDEALKTNVCLKVIHPHLLQTAEEQRHFGLVLRQVSRLSHSNLSRVFETGTAKGRMFYTRQLAEGMSLRRIIDERVLKGGFFSCKEVEPMMAQLVHALAAVHAMGPHLNLKPENIFVLPDLLKLTDVGLGLAIPRVPFVHAQRIRRVEGYFSPEFLSGMEPGAGADVYSLGVIMGEMVAGVLPDSGGASLSKSNPEVPGALEAIYRKSIAASTLVRYRDMAEFYDDFSAFYETYSQNNEKQTSFGSLLPKGIFPAHGAAADALTPHVASGDLSQVELKDLLPKRTVRRLQWVAFIAGALLVLGILLALMKAEPEELTGRNVEGFVPLAPPKTQETEPAPPVPSSEEAVVHQPSAPSAFHTEELQDDTPPVARPEPSRAPSRAGVPPPSVASRCPEQMLRIPAGNFKMGTEKEDAYLSFEDLPAVLREVGGFCIDIYEYPNRHGQLPMVNASWAKAQELCQSQGKRLCTEAEWEKACRGNNGLRWPYGNVFNDSLCNSANEAGIGRTLATSGRFSRCVSAHGVFDMSGNVVEWTEEKILKGGSFSSPDAGARCAARKTRADAASETGFRCCSNLK